MSLTTRPPNFREKLFFRKLRSQVDGNAKVEHGLTQIKRNWTDDSLKQ